MHYQSVKEYYVLVIKILSNCKGLNNECLPLEKKMQATSCLLVRILEDTGGFQGSEWFNLNHTVDWTLGLSSVWRERWAKRWGLRENVVIQASWNAAKGGEKWSAFVGRGWKRLNDISLAFALMDLVDHCGYVLSVCGGNTKMITLWWQCLL